MKHYKGFTLVEIMIVIAIMSLLTALGMPAFIRVRDTARRSRCHTNMRIITEAVQQYSLDLNIASNTNVTLYNDFIMPTTETKDMSLYIPQYLTCPRSETTYDNFVNNTNLNVTCPVAEADKNHGTYNY